ncbi:MAG: hypothetical protein ACOX50_03525 [Patescibacteria group bacterium]|jgi:hypothetical protein
MLKKYFAGFSLFLAIGLVVAGAYFSRTLVHKASVENINIVSSEITPSPQVLSPTPTLSADPLIINFTKTGNLTNFDSEKEEETDTWSLVYEEPGSPAIKVKLSFTAESDYRQSDLENGNRVVVEGFDTGKGEVIVVKLSK